MNDDDPRRRYSEAQIYYVTTAHRLKHTTLKYTSSLNMHHHALEISLPTLKGIYHVRAIPNTPPLRRSPFDSLFRFFFRAALLFARAASL